MCVFFKIYSVIPIKIALKSINEETSVNLFNVIFKNLSGLGHIHKIIDLQFNF